MAGTQTVKVEMKFRGIPFQEHQASTPSMLIEGEARAVDEHGWTSACRQPVKDRWRLGNLTNGADEREEGRGQRRLNWPTDPPRKVPLRNEAAGRLEHDVEPRRIAERCYMALRG